MLNETAYNSQVRSYGAPFESGQRGFRDTHCAVLLSILHHLAIFIINLTLNGPKYTHITESHPNMHHWLVIGNDFHTKGTTFAMNIVSGSTAIKSYCMFSRTLCRIRVHAVGGDGAWYPCFTNFCTEVHTDKHIHTNIHMHV